MVSATLLIGWISLVLALEEMPGYRKDKGQIRRKMQDYGQAKAGAEELGAAGRVTTITRIIIPIGLFTKTVEGRILWATCATVGLRCNFTDMQVMTRSLIHSRAME